MGSKAIKLRPDEEYITLQSLLKITNIISTGGMVKIFLEENEVLVNNERENRRGRKLYPGDKVKVDNNIYVVE